MTLTEPDDSLVEIISEAVHLMWLMVTFFPRVIIALIGIG